MTPTLIQTIQRKCHQSKARFVLFCLIGRSKTASHCHVIYSTGSICALLRSRRTQALFAVPLALHGRTSPPELRERPSSSFSKLSGTYPYTGTGDFKLARWSGERAGQLTVILEMEIEAAFEMIRRPLQGR